MKYLKIFIASLFIFSCRKDFTEIKVSTEKITRTATNEKWVKDEVLVKFKANEANIIKLYGYAVKEKVLTKAMEINGDPGFFVLKVPDVSNAIEVLRKNPDVETAEPDYIQYAWQTYPNDPYFTNNQMWGMKNAGFDKVWPVNKGSQRVYAVVNDEGIFAEHPDLCKQVDLSKSFDYMHNDSTIFDGTDDHGTHVAGTIGAMGGNGIGVIGGSPNITLISLKFLENTGNTTDAIECIDRATELKLSGVNIVAINASWGGGPFTQLLKDAIQRAGNAGILFINAAGNNGMNIDITPVYPASYNLPNQISVAAIDINNNLASFSNYGSTVDIAAPGVNIASTLFDASYNSIYGYYSGTSMATPHVTAAACLYAASHPGATVAEIKSAILNNGRSLVSLQGKTKTGRTLDVSSFTTAYSENYADRPCIDLPNWPPTPPQPDSIPPDDVQNYKQIPCGCDDSTTQIALSWTVPHDNRRTTGYYIRLAKYGTTNWMEPFNVNWSKAEGTTQSTYLVQGNGYITPATNYVTQIRAYDSLQNLSNWSPEIIVKTAGATEPPPPPPPVKDTIAPVITSLTTQKKGKWNVQINTSASDNVGVTRMEIWINNSLMTSCTGSPCSYTWNTRNVQSGSYTIMSKAYDAKGNTGTKTITIFK